MVCVEERCHGVEEVLIAVQILLLLYQLKLEAGADRLVLQTMVVLDVVDQLLAQIAAVVDLEKSRVLLLVGVDAGDLVLHATAMVVIAVVATTITSSVGRWILGVEETARGLHLLIEV